MRNLKDMTVAMVACVSFYLALSLPVQRQSSDTKADQARRILRKSSQIAANLRSEPTADRERENDIDHVWDGRVLWPVGIGANREAALSRIAQLQTRAGDIEGAFSSARALSRSDPLRQSTLESITVFQAISENAEPLGRTRSEISIPGNRFILGLLGRIETELDAGKTTNALLSVKMLSTALRTERGVDSDLKDMSALFIVRTQAKAGQFTEALQTALAIDNGAYRCKSLVTVAAAQRLSGNLQDSSNTRIEALQQAFRLQNTEKSYSLMEIAVEQSRAGAFTEAIQTVSQIQDIAPDVNVTVNEITISPGIYNLRARVLCQVALEQARVGNITDALTTAATVEDGLQPEIERQIAEIQANSGDSSGAIQTLIAILTFEDPSPRGKCACMRTLAEILAKAGHKAEAIVWLGQAVSIATSKLEPAVSADVMIDIAREQAAIGDKKGARQTFQTALDRSAYVIDSDRKLTVLLALATAQANCDDSEGSQSTFQKAFDTAQKEPTRKRVSHLMSIATAQADAGNVSGARATLDHIPQGDTRTDGLRYVAKRLAQKGDVSEALLMAETRQLPVEQAFILIGTAQGIIETLFPLVPVEKEWEWQPE